MIAPEEKHLEKAVKEPILSGDVPVAPIEAIVYLKLKSPRRKDAADVVELVKAGARVPEIRRYLSKVAPDLVAPFDALVRDAEAEED